MRGSDKRDGLPLPESKYLLVMVRRQQDQYIVAAEGRVLGAKMRESSGSAPWRLRHYVVDGRLALTQAAYILRERDAVLKIKVLSVRGVPEAEQ